MNTQRHEIEAWLGDNHGLDDDQIDQLVNICDTIAARYPDADDQPERDAALTAAYRILAGEDILDELGKEHADAVAADARALAGLQQAAHMLIGQTISENAFRERGRLNRMSVRKWLGKR